MGIHLLFLFINCYIRNIINIDFIRFIAYFYSIKLHYYDCKYKKE